LTCYQDYLYLCRMSLILKQFINLLQLLLLFTLIFSCKKDSSVSDSDHIVIIGKGNVYGQRDAPRINLLWTDKGLSTDFISNNLGEVNITGVHISPAKNNVSTLNYIGSVQISGKNRVVYYINGERKLLSELAGVELTIFMDEIISSTITDKFGNTYVYCTSDNYNSFYFYKISYDEKITVTKITTYISAPIEGDDGIHMVRTADEKGTLSGVHVKEDNSSESFSFNHDNSFNYIVEKSFFRNGKILFFVRTEKLRILNGYLLLTIDPRTGTAVQQNLNLPGSNLVFSEGIMRNNMIYIAGFTNNINKPFYISIDTDDHSQNLNVHTDYLEIKTEHRYGSASHIVLKGSKVLVSGLSGENAYETCYWVNGKRISLAHPDNFTTYPVSMLVY